MNIHQLKLDARMQGTFSDLGTRLDFGLLDLGCVSGGEQFGFDSLKSRLEKYEPRGVDAKMLRKTVLNFGHMLRFADDQLLQDLYSRTLLCPTTGTRAAIKRVDRLSINGTYHATPTTRQEPSAPANKYKGLAGLLLIIQRKGCDVHPWVLACRGVILIAFTEKLEPQLVKFAQEAGAIRKEQDILTKLQGVPRIVAPTKLVNTGGGSSVSVPDGMLFPYPYCNSLNTFAAYVVCTLTISLRF
jgi:hypothetical protein